MIGDVNDVELAPPDDTGETVGLLPSQPHRHLRLRAEPVREARPRAGRQAAGGAAATIPPLPADELNAARKRRRHLRAGLLRRPPGRLPRGPQPGPDRPRHGGDALVAARLRPHLDHQPQPGHAAQPDGLQGRHRQHQGRGHRRDGALRLGRAGDGARPGCAAAPTWSPAGSACCSRSGTAPRSKTRSRRSAATSTAAPRSAAATSSTRSPSTPKRDGEPLIPVDAHVRLASA